MIGSTLMQIANWKDPEAYNHADTHTAEQWAWEFLRRNRSYQEEWQAFMDTWRALEAAYGKPPNRDICAWKLDSRAWVPASECPGSDCRVDGERVLIECALGARWGFYKFPPDPRDADPITANRLAWREVESNPLSEAAVVAPSLAEAEKVNLEFDLTLPLKSQLEQAKRYLQVTQKQRVNSGQVRLKRVLTMRERWKLLLRLLDADSAGVALPDMKRSFSIDNVDKAIEEARALAGGDYLELLSYPE